MGVSATPTPMTGASRSRRQAMMTVVQTNARSAGGQERAHDPHGVEPGFVAEDHGWPAHEHIVERVVEPRRGGDLDDLRGIPDQLWCAIRGLRPVEREAGAGLSVGDVARCVHDAAVLAR